MAVSLTTMYAPQNNGPHTALAETINAAQTDITVADASILPTAPNVLTIGTGEDAELVLMSAKTGNIITVTRGYNGTAAKSWETDEWVYRAITAQDVSALQANVNAINAGKVDAESGKGLSSNDYTSAEKQKLAGIAAGANNYVHPSTHPASMITGLANVATSGDYEDLDGKPAIPTVDNTITEGGTNPVTGGAIYTALAGKADAGDIPAGLLQSAFHGTVSLLSTGWTQGDDDWYSQTVTATGVTATAIVYVAFHPDSRSAFLDAGIYCSAQAANQLTFKAASQPESNISVNVHAMEVSA